MKHQRTSASRSFCLDFLQCGLIGWCLECFFTGIGALCNHKHDRRLLCRTSVWMFPIYGLAAFLPFLYCKVKHCSMCIRGLIYSVSIFVCEFLTGILLKKWNACPWDYSSAKLNYKGVIRLDYLPYWALAGLMYERVLCCRKHRLKE